MEESVKKICLNCAGCNSYSKGKYICDIQNYREVLPFDKACELFVILTPEEKQARKEFEEKFPGVFKDGGVDFDSPDYEKMINHLSEIANEKVYTWPESNISVREIVDDSILTTITEETVNTVQDNLIDFKATVHLLSDLFLTTRHEGLISLGDYFNDEKDIPPVIIKEFIANIVDRIVEGTDPDEIAKWCIEEYKRIPEQDDYRKLVLSFSYQALRKLQGGESIKALKVLCWKYVPIDIRSEMELIIEKVKNQYK